MSTSQIAELSNPLKFSICAKPTDRLSLPREEKASSTVMRIGASSGSKQAQDCEKIIGERKHNGPYLHLHDFTERTGCAREQLCLLISIGAFRFTGKSKKHDQNRTARAPVENNDIEAHDKE